MSQSVDAALQGLFIAAVAVVVAVGCGGSDDDAAPTSVPTTTAASNATTSTAAAPTTTVAVDFRDGDALFSEDFSDRSGGWGSKVVADGAYGYAQGAYRIFVETAGRQLTRHIQGGRLDGARVEVQATLVDGTMGDSLGILCYTDVASDEGYMLVISPAEQGHAVFAFRGDSYRLLAEGDEPVEGIRPVGEPNQLEAQCASVSGGAKGSNFVMLTVNGQELAHSFDEELTRGFEAFGMVVDTTEGRADGRFDDLAATELVSD